MKSQTCIWCCCTSRIIYIYIYKTEAFEAPTIFHVIIIFKILALKNKNYDFNNYFSPILLLLPYKNPINSFSFPIFPSSPFFCVYSSFASLAFPFFFCHWCPKPKEIKSLRFFFFFSNKAVYQYGRHYPIPHEKVGHVAMLQPFICF